MFLVRRCTDEGSLADWEESWKCRRRMVILLSVMFVGAASIDCYNSGGVVVVAALVRDFLSFAETSK